MSSIGLRVRLRPGWLSNWINWLISRIDSWSLRTMWPCTCYTTSSVGRRIIYMSPLKGLSTSHSASSLRINNLSSSCLTFSLMTQVLGTPLKIVKRDSCRWKIRLVSPHTRAESGESKSYSWVRSLWCPGSRDMAWLKPLRDAAAPSTTLRSSIVWAWSESTNPSWRKWSKFSSKPQGRHYLTLAENRRPPKNTQIRLCALENSHKTPNLKWPSIKMKAKRAHQVHQMGLRPARSTYPSLKPKKS